MLTDLTAEDLIAFERDVAAAFNAGRVRAPVHLSGGCEEQMIRVFRDVGPRDWICGSWRSHYACLLRGVPREQVMEDVLEGHSITLCYPEHRVITSAIVGGVLPIALGLAWSEKQRAEGARVWAFVGDMTARTGVYRECLDYATGHSLPITFIVEDNGKSVCTDTRDAWGVSNDTSEPKVVGFEYDLPWPHSGAGVRVQF